MVDVGGVPFYPPEIGLRVHGGMWSALHTDALGVLPRIIEKLRARQHDPLSTCGSMKRLVICGHSLGGGYALLTALELFAKGAQQTYSKQGEAPLSLKVYCPEVVTFGCPQVIVPDQTNTLWNSLKAVSTCVVNSWDVIPRLPSCEAWMFRVIPSPKVSGWFMATEAQVEKHLRPVWPSLCAYDSCGTLVFLDASAPGSVIIVDSDSGEDPRSHRPFIELAPEPPGAFIVAHHSVYKYHALTALVHVPRDQTCWHRKMAAAEETAQGHHY